MKFMNRGILCLGVLFSALLVLASGVLGATLARDMAHNATPGSDIPVTLLINGTTPGTLFTLEETPSSGIQIKDWAVEGSQEIQEKIQTREKDNGLGWSFTSSGTSAAIHYTAHVNPQATGTISFEAVYFDSSGFNRNTGTLEVSPGSVSSPGPVSPSSKETSPSPEPESNPMTKMETPGPLSSRSISSPASAPALGQTDSASNPSPWIGMLIIAIIVIGGLAICYWCTKQKQPTKPKQSIKEPTRPKTPGSRSISKKRKVYRQRN